MEDKPFVTSDAHDGLQLLYSAAEIRSRTKQVATQIKESGLARDMVCVCVLQGAVHFFSDLVRHLGADALVAFVQPSSYGDKTVSSGKVTLKTDLPCDVKGLEVLIVDDIVDTGRTVQFLRELFYQRGAKKVCVAALVDKPSARVVQAAVDYAAFTYDGDAFLVGYGMDYAQKFRCCSDIFALLPRMVKA